MNKLDEELLNTYSISMSDKTNKYEDYDYGVSEFFPDSDMSTQDDITNVKHIYPTNKTKKSKANKRTTDIIFRDEYN